MTTNTHAMADELDVLPWPDPVIDLLGQDPRSVYVETYWLGILGPSTTWLLRLLAEALDEHPEGCRFNLRDASFRLGVGLKGNLGKHSPLVRALRRLVQFDAATTDGQGRLLVRRRLPPLPARQVMRLPVSLQEAHRRALSVCVTPDTPTEVVRAKRLARTLASDLGLDSAAVERELVRWGFRPDTASQAAWPEVVDASPSAVVIPITEASGTRRAR